MVYPEYINIKDWFASLVIDYPKEFMPFLENEKDWQNVGAAIASTGVFAQANVPSPFTIIEGRKKENFKDWTDWAKAVYIIMTNENWRS